MTTLGLSIAKEQHSDIVTPSVGAHEALLATREDEVFEALLNPERKQIVTSEQARQELGQLVIAMTGLNFEALRPEEIPELQASKNFRLFQELIRHKAQTIEGRDDGRFDRQDLKRTAQEIIDTWRATGQQVGRSIKRGTHPRR
jgi:hypothetical protein